MSRHVRWSAIWLLGFAAACFTLGTSCPAAPPPFEVGQRAFLRDGKPRLIICGEMHPSRIPCEYWRDRLKKARAMGLNTVAVYAFWNIVEPKPGQFDFAGGNDLARFVRCAQEEGLDVILRPGPYSCAEWDFGGFPAWLLKAPAVKVRCRDERFLEAAGRYLQRLGRELAPLQVTRGGPILMVQVENEYGSYGDDKEYLGKIRDAIRAAGFEVPLFTSDGAVQMAAGSVDGALPAINGATGRQVLDTIGKFRPHGPFCVAEFYSGWLDHWGEPHAKISGEKRAKELDWLLSHDVSVNIYMLHGGTTFAFWNGANYLHRYMPQPTSYDFDAPLDEAGRPRAKFFLFRDVIAKHLPPGTQIPPLPAANPVIEIPPVVLSQAAGLFESLGRPVRSEKPLSMEDLGQSFGYILYRTKLPGPAKGQLAIKELRDYAIVFVDGRRVAELDRRRNQDSVALEVARPNATLDILVENMGRVNYGPKLLDNRKGITDSVTWAGKELAGWEIFPLPMESVAALPFAAKDAKGPAFYRGQFRLERLGDTFLDMRGWGKGCVWLNGHNLGRFWQIGPQQTLYLPAPWLRQGLNEIVVFELRSHDQRSVRGLKDPILDQLERIGQ
jgi:beta-galactosidase